MFNLPQLSVGEILFHLARGPKPNSPWRSVCRRKLRRRMLLVLTMPTFPGCRGWGEAYSIIQKSEKGRLGFFFAKQEQNTWNLKIEAFHISIIVTNHLSNLHRHVPALFWGYSGNSGRHIHLLSFDGCCFSYRLGCVFLLLLPPTQSFTIHGFGEPQPGPSRCLIKSPKLIMNKFVYLASLRALVWDGENVTLSKVVNVTSNV